MYYSIDDIQKEFLEGTLTHEDALELLGEIYTRYDLALYLLDAWTDIEALKGD